MTVILIGRAPRNKPSVESTAGGPDAASVGMLREAERSGSLVGHIHHERAPDGTAGLTGGVSLDEPG